VSVVIAPAGMVVRSGRSIEAARAFCARVVELGGVVVEPLWLGVNRPHRVRCVAGHECSPRPGNVRSGQGICRICAGQDSAGAEARFRARVVELGGVVVEPSWLGNHRPHRVRCAAGHECSPRPTHLAQRNGGLCQLCAHNGPPAAAAAEARFRARVVELGGVVAEPSWLGVDAPHRAVCPAGHECSPRPSSLDRGQGMCPRCGGRDTREAEARFRARVVELGGVVVEPSWLGASARHRVRCAAGHEHPVLPLSVNTGGGICKTCAGVDPVEAWRRFRARVDELGGVVVEPSWLGAIVPHRVRCPEGHECTPTPHDVGQGYGMCRYCAHMFWDWFYVVTNPQLSRLKLGITSGDPGQRLARHRYRGYVDVVRSLAVTDARELERACLRTLGLAGLRPLVGRREYFDLTAAFPVVLDVVDNWPGVADG